MFCKFRNQKLLKLIQVSYILDFLLRYREEILLVEIKDQKYL